MEAIKIVAFAFILWGLQLNLVQCNVCVKETGMSGKISETGYFTFFEKCWDIPVPPGHFIHIRYTTKQWNRCDQDYVKVVVEEPPALHKFCPGSNYTITAFSNVKLVFWIDPPYSASMRSSFIVEYTLKTVECLNETSFQCDNHTCVLEEKVCDGVKDCKNGADEIGCETGILAVKGVLETRENAISWLKQQRTAAWGWKENTPRAVVALYLASGASFNGTVLEEDLMAKQTELKTAVALLKPSLTSSELSLFINALLVTCHNPRHFYAHNLVKRLKDQVEKSGNFTHPLAYLALCNANESWPQRATADLNAILSRNSDFPFVKDLQAMSLTALSCQANRSRGIETVFSNVTLELYKRTIRDFKKLQTEDGSFGNVHTTALITQALLSSGQEYSEDWKLNATIKYLIKELNSSRVDFLATYLVLPILNGKSLADISRINCSANPRKHGDDDVSEISDYVGPKMRVQYSLYIGDQKNFIYTISVRVPTNFSASEVMELAEVKDTKFKFEWKRTSGKMYVYKIANLTNDSEIGKFWLLYVGGANSSEPLTHLTKGPDEIVLGDGDHLVLWYQTTTI